MLTALPLDDSSCLCLLLSCLPWLLLSSLKRNSSFRQFLFCYIPLNPACHCLTGSWLRSLSPLGNSWVSVDWWATLFTKHIYILTRGFNQKNDFNNGDYRCFVMTGQQDSEGFFVCFPPRRYHLMTLSICLLCGCQVNLVSRNFGYLKLFDSQGSKNTDLDFFLSTVCEQLVFETKSPKL